MSPSAAIDVRHGVLLYIEDVTVSFEGYRALDGLSLQIGPGELRCIIGPNGAGKTTLMDVITGRTRPDRGSVHFGQRIDLTRMSEAQIANAGIGRKFQKPSVFEALDVHTNLQLAIRGPRGVWRNLARRFDRAVQQRVDELLTTIGLENRQYQLAGSLSHGQKQWLEIGMLLAQQPTLMLIDEPVAGMTEAEMARTAELLTQLSGELALVVIEHDMGFVRSIAQQVTVLHEGRVLAEGDMQSLQRHPDVARVYLGS